MFKLLRAYFFINLAAWLCLDGCRASYQSVNATPPSDKGLDLSVTPPAPIVPPKGQTQVESPKGPYTMLERSRDLDDNESLARNCKGTITIFERGPDLNKDNMLQPSEITETRSECRLRPQTNDCDSSSQQQGQQKANCQSQSSPK